MSSNDGARATPEQMQRQHIFVVNGSVEFLDVVRELLQDERYNVTTTNFVPHTFQQIETARPSLLIVDLCLGEEAGWDLLTELRQEAATRHIPVILVSTSSGSWSRPKPSTPSGAAIATSSSPSISMSCCR